MTNKNDDDEKLRYIPSWKIPCNAWLDKNVEKKIGVDTPVFEIYNSYISDNPDDYMDIGQV